MARKKTKSERPKLVKNDVQRVGDKIVVTKVWEADAVVKFDDLVEACEVENDDGFREPWKEHDGYDHTFVEGSDYENLVDRAGDDIKEATGRVCRSYRNGGNGLVVLTDTGEDEYRHFRAMGCSKQVAREKQAECQKRLLEQITRWREDGWYVYQVSCDFRDYSESVCGVLVNEEFDDYLEETKVEMAYQVARAMEADGYVIEGKPNWPDPFNVWYSKVNGHRVTHGLITRDRMKTYWEEHVRGKGHVLHEGNDE